MRSGRGSLVRRGSSGWVPWSAAALALGLGCNACSDEGGCDTTQRPLSERAESSLGFSADSVLERLANVETGLNWQAGADWVTFQFDDSSAASIHLQASEQPFEANSEYECARYVGIPVQASLTTADGRIRAVADGELRAFSDHEQLTVLFDARQIEGSIAPTGGIDLLLKVTFAGDSIGGTLSARLVRMTESSLSVRQAVVANLGEPISVADAGASDAAAADAASTSEVILPPPGNDPDGSVQDASVQDAGPGDAGNGATGQGEAGRGDAASSLADAGNGPSSDAAMALDATAGSVTDAATVDAADDAG